MLLDADLNSYVWLSRIATLYYFAYFLVIMPLAGPDARRRCRCRSRSPTPVLSHPASTPAGAAASPEKKG